MKLNTNNAKKVIILTGSVFVIAAFISVVQTFSVALDSVSATPQVISAFAG